MLHRLLCVLRLAGFVENAVEVYAFRAVFQQRVPQNVRRVVVVVVPYERHGLTVALLERVFADHPPIRAQEIIFGRPAAEVVAVKHVSQPPF